MHAWCLFGLPFLGFLSWRCFCTHTHLYLYLQLHLHTYLYLCLYLHVNLAWVVCVCLAFVGLTAKVCLSNRKLEKRCISCEWSSSLDRFKDLKGNILECNYINMYALPRFLFRQVLALKFALITQIYMAFVASAPNSGAPSSAHIYSPINARYRAHSTDPNSFCLLCIYICI